MSQLQVLRANRYFTCLRNWDFVGNDIPVFFIRDGIKFVDLVHSLKPSPRKHVQEGWRVLDFLSHHPESCHIVRLLHPLSVIVCLLLSTDVCYVLFLGNWSGWVPCRHVAFSLQLTWLLGDEGIPADYRHMNGDYSGCIVVATQLNCKVDAVSVTDTAHVRHSVPICAQLSRYWPHAQVLVCTPSS